VRLPWPNKLRLDSNLTYNVAYPFSKEIAHAVGDSKVTDVFLPYFLMIWLVDSKHTPQKKKEE